MLLAASGCGSFRSAESSFVVTTTTTVSEQMRPVPTVTSIPAGGLASTVAPVSGEVLEPPVTEVVGDPQPNPDSREPLPPLPESPVVNACTRLNDLATADALGVSIGAPLDVESIWDEACRFTSGAVTAEVHYVPEAAVESDWFRRDGIEPVGAVTSDAVGLAEFVPPGSSPADGYTIALVSRRQGAVIAVQGSGDDRALAEQLATIVDSTT